MYYTLALADDRALVMKNAFKGRESIIPRRMLGLVEGGRTELHIHLMKLAGTQGLHDHEVRSPFAAVELSHPSRLVARRLGVELAGCAGLSLGEWTDLLHDLHLGSRHFLDCKQIEYIPPVREPFILYLQILRAGNKRCGRVHRVVVYVT